MTTQVLLFYILAAVGAVLALAWLIQSVIKWYFDAKLDYISKVAVTLCTAAQKTVEEHQRRKQERTENA